MNFQDDLAENVSVTSGSMSPDLVYGCPNSPDWDSDIDDWTEDEEFSENNKELGEVNTKGLQKVWEWPCWEGMFFSGSVGCRGSAHDSQQLEHSKELRATWRAFLLPHKERAHFPRRGGGPWARLFFGGGGARGAPCRDSFSRSRGSKAGQAD